MGHIIFVVNDPILARILDMWRDLEGSFDLSSPDRQRIANSLISLGLLHSRGNQLTFTHLVDRCVFVLSDNTHLSIRIPIED